MKEKAANGEELKQLGILLITLAIILKALFYKEELAIVAKTALSLFWLFILPGYFAMEHWREKLGFTERVVIGTALAAAILGITSYYLGILGAHVKYHFIIPALIIAASLAAKTLSKKAETSAE